MLRGWNSRGDQRGAILVELWTALLIVDIHFFSEWIFAFLETEYLFGLDVGLVARQRSWRHPFVLDIRTFLELNLPLNWAIGYVLGSRQSGGLARLSTTRPPTGGCIEM
jgi:hypothetical protein